jgi:hypothetical protein
VISPRALALGDLDGDGDLDLVAAERGTLGTNGYSNDGVWVELNDGAGNFTPLGLTALLAGEDEPAEHAWATWTAMATSMSSWP